MSKVCNLPDLRQAQISDKPILKEMLASYLSELSAFGNIDGDYPYFDAYWQDVDARWPYLFLEGERPVGFALVRASQESGFDFSMAEFSIVPAARQRGYGRKMAAAVMRRHPGSWHVAIMAGNAPAKAFWPSAIAAAGAQRVRHGFDEDGPFYRFFIG
jgi:predicted acetyltransferase